MKVPDTLEQLLLLLKKHGVMHYAGDVEVDFVCASCDADKEEQAPAQVVELKRVEEPDPVDPRTGLTRSQADELFHSSDR